MKIEGEKVSRKGVNKRALAAGIIALTSLAAMAMVYNSAYSTTTITAKNIVKVYVENSSVDVYSPSIFLDREIAKVNVSLSDPDSSNNNSKISYTVIFESPLLKIGAIRSMVIQVYEDDGDYTFDKNKDTRIGVMSPLTPSLVYNTTFDENGTNIPSGGKNITYFLIANGVAFKPGIWDEAKTELGIKASVSLDSVS